MKRKTIILAVVAAAAMAIALVGCGVKITNIAVPERATMEKGESMTLPVAPSAPTTPVQPSNPEPAAPAPAQPDPQPSNPEPSQPSGGNSGSTENKPNGSDGWEWGGPVISTPTDNGCPPEEHAVGWC